MPAAARVGDMVKGIGTQITPLDFHSGFGTAAIADESFHFRTKIRATQYGQVTVCDIGAQIRQDNRDAVYNGKLAQASGMGAYQDSFQNILPFFPENSTDFKGGCLARVSTANRAMGQKSIEVGPFQ